MPINLPIEAFNFKKSFKARWKFRKVVWRITTSDTLKTIDRFKSHEKSAELLQPSVTLHPHSPTERKQSLKKRLKKRRNRQKRREKVVHTNILEILTFHAIDLAGKERKKARNEKKNFYIMWRRFVVFLGSYVSKIKNEIGNCDANKNPSDFPSVREEKGGEGEADADVPSSLVLITNSERNFFSNSNSKFSFFRSWNDSGLLADAGPTSLE